MQFDRSELLTEMVRDVDIMPVDPYENLPPYLPLVPPVLNGRLRGPIGVSRRRAMVGRKCGGDGRGDEVMGGGREGGREEVWRRWEG